MLHRAGPRQVGAGLRLLREQGGPALEREAARARRGIPYRGEHRQAAKRAAADIERHSEDAELGQPERLKRKNH
jgi:hypothetical protein